MLDYIHQKKGLHADFPAPKILFILLLYSASFSLFLAGLKYIQAEQAAAKFKNLQADRRSAASASKDSNAIARQQHIPALQNHLAENILRLHVVADSDAPEDQALKLKVRDKIIDYLRETVRNANSPAQAEELITPQIPKLTAIAQETLARNGRNSPIQIAIENRQFPVKTYGDLTFPAGTYRSLCIDIGTAQGQNWWCVLFPSLCFLDETTATVPEESKEKLKEGLTEEEYQALEQPQSQSKATNPPQTSQERPEVHSALLDWF
jgi:stage II sporulation protein R